MAAGNFTSAMVSLKASSFGIVDYVVFAAFLCVSGAVGIFFSCRSKGTTGEYLFGNRQMKPIPVGISAGVSFMASGALIGIPAEIHVNGYHYLFGVFFGVVACFCGNMLIANVVYPLHMTNLNQYFLQRFNSKVLIYITNVVVIGCILHYMGFCMLGTVIAFSSITTGQVSIVLALVIGGVVGIFYTSIGGLKAVVWTDVIQSSIMFIGIVVVVIKSAVDTDGGLPRILEENRKWGRIHYLDWSPDITIRHTMWGMIIGCFCNWLVWSSQPAMVQRLCSTEKQRDAYIVAAVASLVFLTFTMFPAWAGINIFGYYASIGCDIHKANWIKENEIVLYFIRDRLSIPGFQGLFIAALYSGSLSSLSSGLNAASAIIWKDIAQPMFNIQISERKATLVCKVIVVIFGILSMLWCYALYRFGGLILQVTASIDSSIYGVYFGLFMLAIFFRYINSKGAIAGMLVAFTLTIWLGLCSLLYGRSKNPPLSSPVENCYHNGTSVALIQNATSVNTCDAKSKKFFDFVYSISYVWLAPICLTTLIIVSSVVSVCTESSGSREIDEKLLFPLCRSGICTRRKYRMNSRRNGSTDSKDEEELGERFPTTSA